MDASHDLVQKIVSRSRIVTTNRREDLARELQSHIDDLISEARSLGFDEASIQQAVRQRFGNPEKIAQAFSETYRGERTAVYSVLFAAFIVGSLLTVATAISSLQLLVALGSGATLTTAFSGMRWEALGFVALTWGYTGVYLGERLFPKWPLWSVVAVNAFVFLVAALSLHYFLPGHITTPAIAFACSGLTRALQRFHVPFVWFLGIAAPMFAAWIVLGPLVHAEGRLAPWAMGFIVCIGMTLSCVLLTSLTGLFDRRILQISCTPLPPGNS